MEFTNTDMTAFKKEVVKALKDLAIKNGLIISPKAIDMNLEDNSFNLIINFKKK